MKGAILEKGEDHYTKFKKIFKVLKPTINDYNWLITDCEAYPNFSGHSTRIFQSGDHAWIGSHELMDIVNKDDFQWIWAVLSGFEKIYSHEEVLQYPHPYADGYSGFWRPEVSIQHPLASIELVAWDCTAILLISNHDYVVEKFRNSFPLSQDLSAYNTSSDESILYEKWLENNS